MRFIAMMVGLAASVASWAEITVGVDRLSAVHKNSDGVTIVFPDVCKTPAPGGPIPIPYPSSAQNSDTAQESKRTKTSAPEKPLVEARQPGSSPPATVRTIDAALYALDAESGGKIHIRQTAGRDSVTTATYVDGEGNTLRLREHALIKLDNGDLCAICAAKDGRVTAVYRLVPDNRK